MSKGQELANKIRELRETEGLTISEVAERLHISPTRVSYYLYSYGGGKKPRNRVDTKAIYVAIDRQTKKMVAKGTIDELSAALGLTKGSVVAYQAGRKQGRYDIIDPIQNNMAASLIALIQENPELPVVPILDKTFAWLSAATIERQTTDPQWAKATIGEARVSKVWEGSHGIYEYQPFPSLLIRQDPLYRKLCTVRMDGKTGESPVAYEDLPWMDCIVVEIIQPDKKAKKGEEETHD